MAAGGIECATVSTQKMTVTMTTKLEELSQTNFEESSVGALKTGH